MPIPAPDTAMPGSWPSEAVQGAETSVTVQRKESKDQVAAQGLVSAAAGIQTELKLHTFYTIPPSINTLYTVPPSISRHSKYL